MGVVIDFKLNTMTWDNEEVPLREHPRLSSSNLAQEMLLESIFNDDESFFADSLFLQDVLKTTADERKENIGSNTYRAPDVRAHCKSLSHLTTQQQLELANILAKCPTLWDNQLRAFPDYQMDLELKDDAVPYSTHGGVFSKDVG